MSEDQQTKTIVLNPDNTREREIILRERDFAMEQRRAGALASSDIIPTQFRGNIPNCLIAMEMAKRLDTGELEIMQNLYVVHGRPAFSAAYLIARVNNSGILRGRLRFVYFGNEGAMDYGCFAVGIDRDTGEEMIGTKITMQMANDEGWSTKNGSKWRTMPQQMLAYRAASFWSRMYAPDATMGMHTQEEVADSREEKDITEASNNLSSVNSMLKKPENSVIEQEVEPAKNDTGLKKDFSDGVDF